MAEKFSEYVNNGNLKVYLASPFFSKEQVERIEFIENLLDKYNFDTFSPRKASLVTKDCSKADLIKTFEGNVNHIDGCDFVLCVLDTNKDEVRSDTGTVFEFGYAYAKNKPVLCFNENRDKGINLMLALSGKLPFIIKNAKTSDLVNIEKLSIEECVGSRECLEQMLSLIKDKSLEKVLEASNFITNDIE